MIVGTHVDASGVQRKFRDIRERVPAAVARIINRQASKIRTEASKRIRQQVALPAAYVREKLNLKQATADRPVAVIYANRRGVLLSRFKFSEITAPTTDKRAKNARKAAGIRGLIKPGNPYFARRFFLIRALKDSGAPGIALRTGRGRKDYEVLHGPSVSQVFTTIRDDLSADFQVPVAQAVAAEIRRIQRLTQ